MTIFQALAWPGTAPSIVLTTVALHYAMFSRQARPTVGGALVLAALVLPSLATLLADVLMPSSGAPRENLMPGLGEAMLLAVCIPLTTLSAMIWLIRRRNMAFR